MEVRHLKPMFDLGQLGLMPFSPRDRESIYEAVRKSDVVINLIGKHYETKHFVPTRRADGSLSRVNYDFEEVNVTIPRILAEISKEAGVESFIHVSALAADPNSASKWARTKAAGEDAVREAFPGAVSSFIHYFLNRSCVSYISCPRFRVGVQIVVKPATVFGPEDRFLNWIAQTTSSLPFFPLINNGETLVQPISCSDVGKALMAIVDVSRKPLWSQNLLAPTLLILFLCSFFFLTQGHEEFAGKTFQLAGPAEYSLKEVAEYVADVTTVKKGLVNVPTALAAKLGSFVEQTVQPNLTADHVRLPLLLIVLRYHDVFHCCHRLGAPSCTICSCFQLFFQLHVY